MRRVLLVGLVLAACPAQRTRPVPAPGSVPDRGATTAPGAPHHFAITAVALSPDGTAALTSDLGGGVRLWPTLDGTSEPVPLPLRGARRLSLARRGLGHTVAVVDSAGIGHVLAVDAGRVKVTAELAPLPPLLSLEVLAGGERVLALGRDHVVRLLDYGGRELARLERRGFRPARLCPAETGDAFLAVASDSLQRVRIGAGELALDGAEIPSPEPIQLQRAACAPDARRLGFLHEPKARRREPAPKWFVIVLGPGGEEQRHQVEPGEAALGLVGDERVLYLPDRGGPPHLLSKQGSESILRLGPEGSVVANSFGRGRWVGAIGASLRVAEVQPDGSMPDPPYTIGYDAVPGPEAAALSPDGSLLAWTSTGGEIFVERVGGSEPARRLRPRARWMVTRAIFGDRAQRTLAMSFLDEDHLLVARDERNLDVIETSSGDGVATLSVEGDGVRRVVIERGLIYLERINADALVYEVGPTFTFLGPYSFGEDGGFVGGVGGGGPDGEPIVWRHDGTKFKACTLGSLRSGACRTAKSETIDPRNIPIAIDAAGGRWLQRRDDTGFGYVTRIGGPQAATIDLEGRGLAWLSVSPRSDVAILHGDTSITAHHLPDGKALWSASTMMIPVFSADGARAAAILGGGIAVLDVPTGTIIHRRCATGFGKSELSSPPALAFSATSEGPSLCE